MKKILWIILILVVIIGGWYLLRTSTDIVSKEPIKIGGVFALTGLGASQGIQELNGAQLAVDDINAKGGINGRPLELIPEDVSLDKMNVAATAATKLINVDKVTAIVGTTWGEPAEIIAPIAEKSGIPMVGQNQTRTLETGRPLNYFFSTWYDNEVGIERLLAYAKQKGITKIAIIRPIGAGFYQYISDLVEKSAGNYGITIVADLDLNDPTAGDFRTPLTKIKSKDPDAILMVVNNFTECQVLKQARELAMDVPFLSTEAAGDVASLAQCPKLMENIYFSYPKEKDKYVEFVKAYSAKFKTDPATPSAMTAYDAVMVIAAGLEKTGGEGGAVLRDALAKTKNLPGVSADKISFDASGYVATPKDGFEMRTVQSGKFVALSK